jgi:hypothetical protein
MMEISPLRNSYFGIHNIELARGPQNSLKKGNVAAQLMSHDPLNR